MDGEGLLPHQDGLKSYSLIIEKEKASPNIGKHTLLPAALPLSSVQKEGLPNQGNTIANLQLFNLQKCI